MATKPVEIEILMRDRLSSGLDKAGHKVDELRTKTTGASAEMERLDRQAESVRSTVSKIAGAFAVKELVSNIVKVRGEFQQLEASFNTMLGSEEKADALMQQLIRTAATTPFDLQSVANGARQLLAYGEDVENVNDDLIRLGNIAAGLNQPLNDLVYLYGTTMTQGRLYTQDYNQFVGRGIPLGRELANVLGVAEGKVREMVEAGKVGFPEVQQALQNLTNEGGMFYNLMDEQSKTITGRISNIEDSISMMMNEIGQQSEGIINGSLDAVAYLVDHYEQVGRVLLGLVGTYGVYKTAVMAVTAMQALQTAGVGALTVAETLHYGWLVIVEKAQKLLNATMLANPYVLVATLIAGVVAAMVSMKTETERLKEAEEEYQAAKQKTIEAEEEHRRRLEELCGVAGDESLATDTRREALNRLEQKYPDIFAKYDTEYDKLKNIKRIKEEIAELETSRSIALPENERAANEARIAELEAKVRRGGYVSLTREENQELDLRYGKRVKLNEAVRKEQANAYFENLTGVSNDTLEQQIRQRENLLARMATQQKKYGNITYGTEGLRGIYSRDELRYQLNKLNAEKNRRNLKRDSSADWGAQARKEYEQALKAYNDFLADTSNSLTQEEYEKKAKELKDALSLAKKEYDSYRPDSDKNSTKVAKAAEQSRKEQDRYLRLLDEQNRERKRATEDAERSISEARVTVMAEGAAKERAQLRLDFEREIQDITRQAEDLKAARIEAAREAYEANPANKGKSFDASAYARSDEAQDYFTQVDRAASARQEAAFQKLMEQRMDRVNEERRKWQEYYRHYGDLLQQVDAIDAAYNEAINTPGATEADRATAEAERTEALRRAYAEAAEGSSLIAEAMQETATKSVGEIQSIIDRIRLLLAYLAAAKDGEGTAQIDGQQVTRSDAAALAGSEGALSGLEHSADGVKALGDALKKLDTELGSRSPFKKFEQQVKQAAQLFKEGGTDNVATGIGAIGKAAVEFAPALEEFGQSIGTLLGDGVGNAISNVAGAVGGLGTSAMGVGQIMSGDVAGGIMSCVNGASQLVGALEGMFGADYSEYNQLKSEYDGLIEVWDQLLERKRAYIDESYGTEAAQVGEEALALLGKEEEAARELARERLGAGSSAGSHSIGYRMWEGSYDFNGQTWKDVAAEIREGTGAHFYGIYDFTNLTAEQLLWIKENYAGLWAHMDSDFRGYLENIIEYGDTAEDIVEGITEKLTAVSFDSMYDGFFDKLMDMEATAEDFADDLSEYFMKAMLSDKVSKLYSDRLEEWWNDFAKAMEDGEINNNERSQLQETYLQIADEALALRDEVAEATGYTSDSEGTSQSGKAGTYTAMSQEQGTKLEGLWTTSAMHLSNMDEQMQDVSQQMGSAVDSLRRIEENTGTVQSIWAKLRRT
jgi:tape measure domain-containing protein